MKNIHGIKLGMWLVLLLNLTMAIGSIWIFNRMAPAIETIIEQNERSLFACEEMLVSLASYNEVDSEPNQYYSRFTEALNRAKNNITELEEPDAIAAIVANYIEAFNGDAERTKQTLSAIQQLSEINRNAMVRADYNARQLGIAGAWGIVFMALVSFWVGIVFMRSVGRNLLTPLKEVSEVVHTFNHGDSMRRCTSQDASQDVLLMYREINALLDECNRGKNIT